MVYKYLIYIQKSKKTIKVGIIYNKMIKTPKKRYKKVKKVKNIYNKK